MAGSRVSRSCCQRGPHGNAPSPGRIVGDDRQNGSQGCARYGAPPANRMVPAGPRQEVDAREQRAMLSARATLVARLKDIENSVRGLLRGFGLRLPKALRGRWDAGVREAVAGHPTLLQILDPLLVARGALREQLILLDKRGPDSAKAQQAG